MKRFFSSVLVLTLSAALLTGCGGNGGDNTKGSGGSTGSNSDSVENNGNGAGEDSVVLKYYFLTASGATSDLPLIEEKLNEYIEPIIGATVDMTLINVGSYADQVGLMVRTGEPVDLVFGFQAEMLSYVSQGAVMPLDDLLAEYGQGIIDAVGQDVLDSCKQQGVLYSIPTLKDMAAGRVFIYNQEVADELGLDFSNVKSEKDLTEIFEIVKEKTDLVPFAGAGGGNKIWENWSWDTLCDQLGVLMDGGAEPVVVNLFETDYYKELVTMTRDWYLNGYLISDYATSEDTWSARMINKTSFGAINANKPGGLVEIENTVGYDLGQVEILEEFAMTGNVLNTNWMIPTGSEHPEKAMQFLDLMYSDPYVSSLLINGIEGVHYTTDEDGFITTVPDSGYINSHPWAQGNQFISKVYAGNDADVWEQQEEYNKNAKKSVAYGFIFDSSNVTNEITACNNVVAKYRASLECGAVDPEVALPEFNAELKTAGIDTIIAEKQRQLDEWLENNGASN
ncbi:MAG: ABC transporter substrate-binding protein [Clostridiales bacterium]|nr:ABC transporter substrate-binding protein [Clostridiales bacterium]